MSGSAITLHGTKLSGHVHRVELLLRLLGSPYAYRDAPAAVRGTAAFLALNPLKPYPSVRAWLARIEVLPGFLPTARLPVSVAG